MVRRINYDRHVRIDNLTFHQILDLYIDSVGSNGLAIKYTYLLYARHSLPYAGFQ
jgi:hypothetical protein